MKNVISKNQFLAPLAKTPWLLLFIVMFALTGCQTGNGNFDTSSQTPPDVSKQSQPEPLTQRESDMLNTSSPESLSDVSKQFQSESLTLREGDILNISFPGSPTLDTAQQIRTDGKIVLSLVGEVTAAGKTPEELQSELLKLYQPQVAVKQVIVTVQSSTIPFYVTGAVLRPGPVVVNHPISALDAVMEAGGFDYTRANPRAVVVIRQEKDRTVKYKLNLKKALAGSEGEPFFLKPYDIIYVPERFTWF
jgi:polysaccharide biosynthesis/export protein